MGVPVFQSSIIETLAGQGLIHPTMRAGCAILKISGLTSRSNWQSPALDLYFSPTLIPQEAYDPNDDHGPED
jgi:hypothetical protein